MNRSLIKGPVRALRGAFVASHPVRYLSRTAEETLFQTAQVLSEGSERKLGSGQRSYFGSTMITFDLQQLASQWRGPFDADARAALLELAWGSVRVRARATRIACAEAARRVTERPLGTAIVECKLQLRDDSLLIDVDLEVPIGISSLAGRAP